MHARARLEPFAHRSDSRRARQFPSGRHVAAREDPARGHMRTGTGDTEPRHRHGQKECYLAQ